MPARLVSLSGYPDIDLVDVLTVVGRGHQCSVRVSSSRVSRRHCCLALGQESLIVRDLCSTNGTFINGHQVGHGLMRAGEELAIAHLRYRLEIGDTTLVASYPPDGPEGSSRDTVPDFPLTRGSPPP
jgi:pSer/pThr/pTyr-binding forkhead associated (FHA) protein